MANKDEIKEVTAWKFAGQIYEDKEDAERRLAELDLWEFVEGQKMELALAFDEKRELCQWMGKNYEKLISLLNKFY